MSRELERLQLPKGCLFVSNKLLPTGMYIIQASTQRLTQTSNENPPSKLTRMSLQQAGTVSIYNDMDNRCSSSLK